MKGWHAKGIQVALCCYSIPENTERMQSLFPATNQEHLDDRLDRNKSRSIDRKQENKTKLKRKKLEQTKRKEQVCHHHHDLRTKSTQTTQQLDIALRF